MNERTVTVRVYKAPDEEGPRSVALDISVDDDLGNPVNIVMDKVKAGEEPSAVELATGSLVFALVTESTRLEITNLLATVLENLMRNEEGTEEADVS